jgi:hypothetical protein
VEDGRARGAAAKFCAVSLLVMSLTGVVVCWKNCRMLPACTASSPFFFRGIVAQTRENLKKNWRKIAGKSIYFLVFFFHVANELQG